MKEATRKELRHQSRLKSKLIRCLQSQSNRNKQVLKIDTKMLALENQNLTARRENVLGVKESERKNESSDEEAGSQGHDSGKMGVKTGCCDSKFCWWEPPLDSLPLDFCNNTSLHGLKYLGQSKRHLSERVFWFLAFLIGCFAAIYLISDVWRKYQESPVIVSFEPIETNIDKIPFPAVTICNMNKVLRSKAEEYIRLSEANQYSQSPELISAEIDSYYLDHVCSSSKSFTKKFNYSLSRGSFDEKLLKNIAEKYEKQNEKNKSGGRVDVRNFLRRSSQPCADMIRLCTWKDKIHNCSEIFRPVDTDFGKCCTFNMVPQTLLHIFQTDQRDSQSEVDLWNSTNLEETWLTEETSDMTNTSSSDNLRPRRQNQAGKSFGLSILLDPDIDEYFCTTSDSVGFRLATHFSTENPHVVDYGLAIMPESEVFISIKPEITKADRTINGYPLNTRNCYFPYEFNLTYFQYYSASNCVDECIAETVFQQCGCVRYYMPRDDSRALCGPKKFHCTEDVKKTLADVGLKRNCNQCLPSCTEIIYFDETTTTPLQTDHDLWESLDPFTRSKWSKNNLSIVHIYIGQDSTYARIRKELYGTTDLFANTGGLMGLCLGFSGLSAIEVLYFLTLRAWCRKRRRQTIGVKVAEKFRDIWIKVKGVRKYGKGSGNLTNLSHQFPKFANDDLNGSRFLVFNKVSLPVPPTPVAAAASVNSWQHVKNMNKNLSLDDTDTSLPTYTSVVNEINTYYANKHWNAIELTERVDKKLNFTN